MFTDRSFRGQNESFRTNNVSCSLDAKGEVIGVKLLSECQKSLSSFACILRSFKLGASKTFYDCAPYLGVMALAYCGALFMKAEASHLELKFVAL